MINFGLFAIFPYVAVSIMLVVSFYRYFSNSYKFSSLSSEFLESENLFWGSVPWHYGIMTVLLGHLIGFLFPREVLLFNSVPIRLVVLELTAFVFGLMALFGLVMLIRRRMTNPRIKVVTTKEDIIVLLILLAQVMSGVGTAVFYRWGSNWYASSMVPYLKSVLMFQPNIGYVATLPWLVKTHIVCAFSIIAILPFTRLVHFLVLPIKYIWRSWQVVIWNWDRKNIRKP